MKPFTRRQQNIDPSTPDPEDAPQPLPPGMGEWVPDSRVDGATVETISDREAHARRGSLDDAQRAGWNALAQLAGQQARSYAAAAQHEALSTEVAKAEAELAWLKRRAEGRS